MQLFTPVEVVTNYIETGVRKCAMPLKRLFPLAILAGMLIAIAGAATNTAAFGLEGAHLVRLVCGLLFPFGLAMVVLLGAELFTGNTLIFLSVMDRKVTAGQMVRNWVLVYVGNLVGALIVGAGCAFFGQLNQGDGALAVYTIRLAATKCAITFPNGVVSGFFCNFLVTLGVMLSLGAKDVTGRILGAFLPVCFFVLCGFEHSIANMYYISAGIFAVLVEKYRTMAQAAGVDVTALTWVGFVFGNLLPVTIGNILGGLAVSGILYRGHKA